MSSSPSGAIGANSRLVQADVGLAHLGREGRAFRDTAALLVATGRPRMRGQMHAIAAPVSAAIGVALVACAVWLRTGEAAVSAAIYSLSVLALFTISGLYHRKYWPPRALERMDRLDHSMIFVLIAGTYTPVAVLALPHVTGAIVLWVVWSGAAIGVLQTALWPAAPRWAGIPLYLALGWTAAFVLPDLLHGAGIAAFVLIVAGGVAYTVGAITYATKRPDPRPATFGYHEVFHAWTLVAATCHCVAIWLITF